MQPFVVLMAKLHDVLVKVSESCGGTAAASAAKRSALLLVKVLSPEEGVRRMVLCGVLIFGSALPWSSLLNLRVSEALGRLAA